MRRVLALLVLLSLLAPPPSGALTFLGADGAATRGRASVAWVDGVSDSLVQTFGLSPDTVYADRSFNAAANHYTSGFLVWLATSSSLYLAPAGVADSNAAVAHGALYEYDFGSSNPGARRAVASLDLALRYQSSQPTIYWAMIESRPGANPPPGPAGEVVRTRPAADVEVSYSSVGTSFIASHGHAPNTGRIDFGGLIRALRPSGQVSNWNFSWGFDLYLSDEPLGSFVAGADRPATPARIALAAPRPNPARGGTSLVVELPAPAHVTLEIVDVAGRCVRTLLDGTLPGGVASVRWNGDDARGARAGAGVYFARLIAGGETRVRKIALVH